MDPALQKQITAVQNVLGKYVKKPVLAEKHLARPPFRFLQDIFIAVMNTTGFYAGLFTPGEIESTGLNTKEEKTEFLTKVIEVTGLATGSKVEARVGKILAGQDPEKTLDFLLVLGGALERGVSSKDAVATVVQGGTGDKKKEGKPAVSKTKESKVKEEVKKSTGQTTVKPTAGQAPPPKGQGRHGDKEKPNVKPSTISKTSPASKPNKVAGNKKEVKGRDDKRDRSRSRDPPKRQDSKPTPPAPLSKNVSKEDLLMNRTPTKATTVAPATATAVTVADTVPAAAQSPAQAQAPVPAVEELPTKIVEPDVEFMGEVESLLQEHGIQIEEEKRSKNTVERKLSATKVKTVAEKPSQAETTKSEDVVDVSDSIVLPPIIPPLATIRPASKTKLSITKPTSVPVPVPAVVADDSDVDTDDSEVAPLKPTPIKKAHEGGSSESESGRLPVPSSAIRRAPSAFGRPTSARPAPPRPKTAIVEEESPYRPPTTKIPVILDSEEVEEEESSESRKQGLLDLLATTAHPLSNGPMSPDGGDISSDIAGKGHLVQQIVETKRELEAGDKGKDELMHGLRKQGQVDLDQLKGLIQSSARLANPLGRILDFLQEDIDAMTTEYVKYQGEEKGLQDLLQIEKEITRQRLKPKRIELMEVLDKVDQQTFEIRAAFNDLQVVEEHLNNYMTSLDAGPDRVDIPTRFLVKNDWEFDLESATEDHAELESKARPRSGPFGSMPPFLCLSAQAREADKVGKNRLVIPKPKRKPAPGSGLEGNNFKKPVFSIDSLHSNGEDRAGSAGRSGFFGQGSNKRYGERRRSSQFLELPEPALDSLEILSEK